MQYDVIIVGGSYSGMAAALQLVRARRQVLIIDAGVRRNRFARHSHGFIGQDGISPDMIFKQARDQLIRYPTMHWHHGLAVQAKGSKDNFEVQLESGEIFRARRVLFALGVEDCLPDTEGMSARWGKTVFHCPYCHGYELDQGDIAVIAASDMSVHQAIMVSDWGRVTFFLNQQSEPAPEALAALSERHIVIETSPLVRLSGEADIELQDGRVLSFAGVFTTPSTRPASDIAQRLGCQMEATMTGTQIQCDSTKETTISGAFACGDTARMPHSVSLAVGDGAWAGACIHRTLIF